MVCKKCRFDFCWVCLGPWEPHGSSWYVYALPVFFLSILLVILTHKHPYMLFHTQNLDFYSYAICAHLVKGTIREYNGIDFDK